MDTHLAVCTDRILRPALWLAAAAALTLASACGDSGPATAATGSSPAATGSQASRKSAQPGAPVAGVLRGEIVLADGLAEQLPAPVQAYDSLFIIGRRPGDNKAGLITKVPLRDFPIPFQLDARDMMGIGTMSGDWHLSVRLDSDGDATALEGDVEGASDGAVSVGDNDIRLVLSTVRSESGTPVVIDGQDGGHGAPAERMLGSATRAGANPHGGAMPAGHPPVSDGRMPADQGDPAAVTDPPAVADSAAAAHSGAGPAGQPARIPGPRIQGTIDMDAEYAGSTGTLYIIVKAQRGPRMPRLAMKIDAPTFPLEFDMGPEHVPLAVDNKAEMVVGDLVISARLDFDGNAMTKGPQDVECAAIPVVPDGDAVSLVLNRRPK